MRKRVLLVEDEASLRSALAEILRWEGYDVETFEDGAAALERLATSPPPDIMVLDLLMPVLSGSELLVRAKSLLRSIPVIVISGAASDLPPGVSVAVRLQKPVPPADLIQALEYCSRLGRRAPFRRAGPNPRPRKPSSAKEVS
ncbi:MAG TPA: response regulator [Thermoanaerobaculia bacterium]